MEGERQEENRVASGVLWGKSGPEHEAITRCRKWGRKGGKKEKEKKKMYKSKGKKRE